MMTGKKGIKYSLTAAAAGFVFALDQAVKLWVYSRMEIGETIELIPHFFNIHYIRNPGGVFGLFAAGPEFLRFILFLLFPVLCIVFIFFMLKETENKTEVTALGFVLGGALGNYTDRLKFGAVIDFIDWHAKDLWHWPTFNIADSFIVVGVGLVIFLQLKDSKRKNGGGALPDPS